MVGNDIVDIGLLEAPSYQHVAHLERVCTSGEARFIRNAANPSVMLAAVWAAKEAAFKLISKRQNCCFVPGQFVVRFCNPAAQDSVVQGFVTYSAAIDLPVELSMTALWVHAVATFPGGRVIRWAVREITQCRLGGRQARDESEAVRFLAAELISRYCPAEVVLEMSGRMPILTIKTGGRSAFDVSFSHHGLFASVAIAWPLSAGQQIMAGSGWPGNASPREETCSTCTA